MMLFWYEHIYHGGQGGRVERGVSVIFQRIGYDARNTMHKIECIEYNAQNAIHVILIYRIDCI